jgi:hypothetical protein
VRKLYIWNEEERKRHFDAELLNMYPSPEDAEADNAHEASQEDDDADAKAQKAAIEQMEMKLLDDAKAGMLATAQNSFTTTQDKTPSSGSQLSSFVSLPITTCLVLLLLGRHR